MTTDTPTFSTGDWLIHRTYGVGQVVDLEEKRLHRQVRQFYKVRTNDSTFWLPLEKPINSRVEPLPSKKELKKAISIFKKSPEVMGKNANERKDRINRVQTEGSLIAIAKLIRDLTHLASVKNLTATEQRALKALTDRFTNVWSVCRDINVEKAGQQLNQILLRIADESES
jgi:RNA polymerase-interacting CarD/CdnL/TRCF family regulator